MIPNRITVKQVMKMLTALNWLRVISSTGLCCSIIEYLSHSVPPYLKKDISHIFKFHILAVSTLIVTVGSDTSLPFWKLLAFVCQVKTLEILLCLMMVLYVATVLLDARSC